MRELRNVIERALILEDTGDLLPEHLPPEIGPPTTSPSVRAPAFQLPETGIVLEEVERELVRQALELTQGNQTRAAHLLGLTRDELRYRAKKFGLNRRPEEDAD